MSAARVVRRQCNAPQFNLNFTPRPLIPMEALRTDACGNTVWGICQDACHTFNPCNTSPFTTTSFLQSPRFEGLHQQQHFHQHNAASVSRASEILSGLLFLGDHADATPAALRARGIKYVLNVAVECENQIQENEEFTVRNVPLRDHSDEDLASWLDDCVEWLRWVIVDVQQPVLVHCRMGVSRSASIIIAFLIRYGIDIIRIPSHLPNNSNNQKLNAERTNPKKNEGKAIVKKHYLSSTRNLYYSMSYDDAFDYVKTRRPLVSPNLGFVLTLHEWATKAAAGAAAAAEPSMASSPSDSDCMLSSTGSSCSTATSPSQSTITDFTNHQSHI